MTGCVGVCPREQVQLDPISIGAIGDDEFVARGAFYPSHTDKAGKVTNQLFKKSDLLQGTGSVWRVAPVGRFLDELIPELEASRPNNPLKKVLAVKVGKIRGLMLAAGGREFSVVDECDSDINGGKHPAHAHIAICKAAIAGVAGIEDPIVIQAHRDLLLLFRNGAVWESLQLKAA